MSYHEVMDMPLRAFWSFNGCVTRLRAEEDLRAMQVAGASQTGDGFKDFAETLKEENGTPSVVIDLRRDGDAKSKLKAALTG